MKTKYFNEFEFKSAFEFIDKNPFIAKTKFENYIKKYPTDYSAYPYYISSLIIIGNFDEAEKHLRYLEQIKYTNDSFKHQLGKMKILKNNVYFSYFKLLSYQHKYNELYKFCKDNFSIIVDLKLTSLVFYCRKKLNLLDKSTREGNTYLYRQILDYDEEDFLDHIKKHLADFNKDLDVPNSNIFSPNFPISKVIEAVKNCIPSDKRLLTGFYEDTYVFKYDYCGRVNNKITNYFKVVCFNDTNDIITMFPTTNCEELPFVDLNHLNLTINIENSKVKKLSDRKSVV